MRAAKDAVGKVSKDADYVWLSETDPEFCRHAVCSVPGPVTPSAHPTGWFVPDYTRSDPWAVRHTHARTNRQSGRATRQAHEISSPSFLVAGGIRGIPAACGEAGLLDVTWPLLPISCDQGLSNRLAQLKSYTHYLAGDGLEQLPTQRDCKER